MFNKINKIEEIINSILEKVRDKFIALIPPTIKERYQSKKNSLMHSIETLKLHAAQLIKKNKAKLIELDLKNKIRNVKSSALNYLKTLVSETKEKGPTYVKETFRDLYHQMATFAKSCIAKNKGPCALILLGIIIGATLFFHQDIPEVLVVKPRPPYYRKNHYYYYVGQINIPTTKDGQGKYSDLILQIEIQLSSRTLVNHFTKNSAIVKSYLIKHLRPMRPNFIFTKEGKTIIRARIAKILNLFIEETQQSGKVEKVFIRDLLTS